jgi:hypothetical protein
MRKSGDRHIIFLHLAFSIWHQDKGGSIALALAENMLLLVEMSHIRA